MNITKIIFFVFLLFICVSPAVFSKPTVTVIPEVSLHLNKKSISKSKGIATTELNNEAIKNSPAIELTDFLQEEQSMARITKTSGDSQAAISIRGFGDNASANSLLLIDGFPITNPSLLAPNLNAISLLDIKTIEILQGSRGVLYGDQAVGGVVNILTKTPQKFYKQILLSFGTPLQYTTTLNVGSRFKDNFFLKTYFSFSEFNHSREHNHERQKNASLQIGKEYTNGVTKINLQTYAYDLQLPGGLSYQQFRHDPFQASNYKNNVHLQNNIFQFLNKHALNNTWFLETRLIHNETNVDGLVFFTITQDERTNRLMQTLIGELYHAKVNFGYDVTKTDYNFVRNNFTNEANSLQNSFFIRSIIPINTALDLTLGVRNIQQRNDIQKNNLKNSSTQQVFLSEQGLTYRLNNQVSFFIRRDNNVSFPKANELVLSQENLKVQQGVSYETGGIYLSKDNELQINFYNLFLTNEIAYNPMQTPDYPFGSFTNFARTKRTGVSIVDKYQFNEKIILNGQVNYVHSRFASGVNKGKLIPAVPNLTANAGINYSFNQNWQAKYRLLFTGTRFPSQDIYNTSNKLPSYFLHDIALQYIRDYLNISFEINNVLNKVYPNFVFFDAKNNKTTFFTGEGRYFVIALKMDF